VLVLPAAVAAAPGPRIEAFVKLLARHRLSDACDRYAAQVGRKHAGLTLRDTRSRWGSCSAAGKLMFSWRLAMAPPEVLDYVAAHEVAHLVEMNHAPAFWAVVARLMPDYQRHRNWLKQNGATLQAIRFRD
jgi:predicted metal-dependent hydrolase